MHNFSQLWYFQLSQDSSIVSVCPSVHYLHDLTDNLLTYLPNYLPTYYREHPQEEILQTCETFGQIDDESWPDQKKDNEIDKGIREHPLGCFSKTLFQKKIRAIPSRTPLGCI